MEGVKYARDDLIDKLDECETTLRGARNRIGELDDELAATQVKLIDWFSCSCNLFHFFLFWSVSMIFLFSSSLLSLCAFLPTPTKCYAKPFCHARFNFLSLTIFYSCFLTYRPILPECTRSGRQASKWCVSRCTPSTPCTYKEKHFRRRSLHAVTTLWSSWTKSPGNSNHRWWSLVEEVLWISKSLWSRNTMPSLLDLSLPNWSSLSASQIAQKSLLLCFFFTSHPPNLIYLCLNKKYQTDPNLDLISNSFVL